MGMLPEKKTPKKTDMAGLTVLAYGAPKIGKCLAGDTLLVDPVTGRLRTLSEIVHSKQGSVHSLRIGGHLAPAEPAAYLENPPEQLFRLCTQTGRTIDATASHPFLTREGWKTLGELGPADRVAVVAEYPCLFGTTRTDDELVKILAYLLADGSLTSTSPIFTKSDPEVRLDFENAVEAKGDECVEFLNSTGIVHVRVRGKRGQRNNVIGYLKDVGVAGLGSSEKFIPDFVFGLKRHRMALFLNRLFSCDGSLEACGRVSYSSTSIRMVRQVQHLLLRYGIVGIIRDRYLNGSLYGAEIAISSRDNVLAFIDQIGFIGEKAVKAEQLRAALYNIRSAETQLDRVGSILFDRVASVKAIGVEPVFDLTISESHNFVANDFVVHNSTFCAQIPDALFLATEPGLNHLEVYQVPISNWEQMLDVLNEVAKGKHGFKCLVVDTVDLMFKHCLEYVCNKHGVKHPSDLAYGKGHALVNGEFTRVVTRMAQLGMGLVLTSHAQDREVEGRNGTYTKTTPTLPDGARKALLGFVDIIAFVDVEADKGADGAATTYRRVVRTKPSMHYEAGDRTGRLPEVLPLDYSAFAAALTVEQPPRPKTNNSKQ